MSRENFLTACELRTAFKDLLTTLSTAASTYLFLLHLVSNKHDVQVPTGWKQCILFD